MKELRGKRLLILGGSLWKEAIRNIADQYGITLIATGNDQSAGIFDIADEKYNVNSTDSQAMKRLIVNKKIDGVYMGGSESVISRACDYLNDLKLPCYCTKQQWEILQNKSKFKELCKKHSLPVVKNYDKNVLSTSEEIEYPVITKPADSCGSSGFSICHNFEELVKGYNKAEKDSTTGEVVIEDFVNNEGIVVFYTVSKGRLIFSGLEDKYPVKYKKHGSYVGGLFVFDSYLTENFRKEYESKIKSMIDDIGILEGSFWIEVFYSGNQFYFNEAGFRYGGTASLYPVNYLHGINQVGADIYYALTGKSKIDGFISCIPKDVPMKKFYSIYPIFISGGTIKAIEGINKVYQKKECVATLVKYSTGCTIEDSGTFSQVFALIHFVFDREEELKYFIADVHEKVKVVDKNNKNMIMKMLNINNLSLKSK